MGGRGEGKKPITLKDGPFPLKKLREKKEKTAKKGSGRGQESTPKFIPPD